MADHPDYLLAESETYRDERLANITEADALWALVSVNPNKPIKVVVLERDGAITIDQLAEWSEVPARVIKKAIKVHQRELEKNGLQILTGRILQEAKQVLPLPLGFSQATVLNTRAALRLICILHSQLADRVRAKVNAFGKPRKLNFLDFSSPLPLAHTTAFELAEMVDSFEKYDPCRHHTEHKWWSEPQDIALARTSEFGQRFFAELFNEFPILATEVVFQRWSFQPEDVYAVFNLPGGEISVQIEWQYIVVCGADEQAEHGDWVRDKVDSARDHFRDLVRRLGNLSNAVE